MHQKKLDEELQLLEERFQEKKRTMIDSSEKFTCELNKRFASKPVDEAAYQRMFDSALEQIKKENAPRSDPNINAPSVESVLPTNSAECVTTDKLDSAVDDNRSHIEDVNPNVVPPVPQQQSTDSSDFAQELHNMKENTSLIVKNE